MVVFACRLVSFSCCDRECGNGPVLGIPEGHHQLDAVFSRVHSLSPSFVYRTGKKRMPSRAERLQRDANVAMGENPNCAPSDHPNPR